MAKIYSKITELIGSTPIMELTNYEKANNIQATILGKLEYFNPAGSVKDRIALEMINRAEAEGKLKEGAIKRWNFGRLKETHGTGPVARHQGSMGACSDPSRVFKGKKMPGHLGAEKVTIQNLDVVKVDAENNLIAVKGAVPGAKGGYVVITNAVKKA